MSWRDELASAVECVVLPYVGRRAVWWGGRLWEFAKKPQEHGWYECAVSGRMATPSARVERPDCRATGVEGLRGYVIENRFVPDGCRVPIAIERLGDETIELHLVEPGLAPFSRCLASDIDVDSERYVYLDRDLPLGPEADVLAAFEDRCTSLDGVKGVTPGLDLAFRWATWKRNERERVERERAERRARREAEERAERDGSTAVGRRAMATRGDLEGACRAALRVSGAELLSARDGYDESEVVVRYRLRGQRFECVVDRATLRVVDAGICLTDHRGERGDTRFTLESLPGVVAEAVDTGRLVVMRHA